VWEGSYVVIDLLKGKLGDDLKGKKVVELGSGTGLAGLCAAAVGAHVLMSDIATVTDFSLRPNVERNGGMRGVSDVQGAWPGSGRVGEGSATCMAIDWTKGVDEQAEVAGQEPCDCDVVLAAECVWLVELVEPFVKTVSELPITSFSFSFSFSFPSHQLVQSHIVQATLRHFRFHLLTRFHRS